MKYRVVLPGRPPGNISSTARAMAAAFNMSEAKAEALLRSTPGPLTKPVDEREAVRVAYRLRRLGLSVDVRPVETDESAGSVGTARSARGAADRVAERGPERASDGGTGASQPSPRGPERPAVRQPAREPIREPILEPVREPVREPDLPASRGIDRQANRESARRPAAAVAAEPPEAPRSPFLSDVEEAPSIPSAEAWERDWTQERSSYRSWGEGDRAADSDAAAHRRRAPAEYAAAGDAALAADEAGAAPASASAPLPAPYRGADALPAGAGAADRRAKPRLPFARRLILAAVLPGLLALLGAVLAYAAMREGTPDALLEGVAATSAGMLDAVLEGRDPTGPAARADVQEAVSETQASLLARGVELLLVTTPDGAVLAGWQGAGRALAPEVERATAGLGAVLVRAQSATGPVSEDIGGPGARMRAAVAPVYVRGEAVAAVVVGAAPGFPVGRGAAGVLAGFVLLALAATVVWLANRPLLRENQRLLEEMVRISRGDLSRPVYASDRFPDTVQALERIRVSLQEGLERLRRRKK